jgi:XTP/dITP diphosphohydrolase
MKLVLATQNPNKLIEMRTLAELTKKLKWLSLELAPDEFNPEETGSTFAENALIKAKAAAALTNKHSLSDDSGICVDALDGRPGIYSSRYSEGSEYNGCLKLIDELKTISPLKRTATYHCVMTLVAPDGQLLCQGEGIWHGLIIDKMRGDGGFGYDPIFYLNSHDQTAAEIGLVEKNRISHRAQAWNKIAEYLIKQHQFLA